MVGLEFGLLRVCIECKPWLFMFIDNGGGNRGFDDAVGEVMKIFGLSLDSKSSAGNGGTIEIEMSVKRANISRVTSKTACITSRKDVRAYHFLGNPSLPYPTVVLQH